LTSDERRISRRALLGGAFAVAGTTASLAGCSSSPGQSAAVSSTSTTGAPRSAAPPEPSASVRPDRKNPAGPDITHGPTNGAEVALTFHGAGDPALLTRLLADVGAANAKVTVLAVGRWLAARPAMARQILDGGHELGNHTWSHQTMPRLDARHTLTEVERAAAELHRITGSIGNWFRPSGTPHSTELIRRAAGQVGYGACLAYDLDPLDYTDPGPSAIVRRVRSQIRPGAIVSLHLGHPQTIAAMPGILRALDEHGLSAVTASDLLARS
jgi:peptidoglycan/xylan/chitin deacetylase (PgdA/CDA1 family)